MNNLFIQGMFMSRAFSEEAPDALQVIDDFKRNSMARYRKEAESLLSGWMLDADQQFTIGDEIKTVKADKDDTKVTTWATCPANGELKLLHAFDSVNFVPIGNTPYEVRETSLPLFSDRKPQIFSGTLDENGLGSIIGCHPNRPYIVRFYPNVGEADLQKLYASYDDITAKLHQWLVAEWNGTIAEEWRSFAPAGDVKRLQQINQRSLKGTANALISLWDEIKKAIHILTHPDEYYEKLRDFISDADIQTLKAQAKDLLHTALLILNDEPLMFLYASAVVCWVQLQPPTVMAELYSQIMTSLLINILLCLALQAAGLQARMIIRILPDLRPRAAGLLEKALQSLMDSTESQVLKAHAATVKPLAVKGEVRVNSSQKSTVHINSPVQGIDQTEANVLSIKRSKQKNTQVTQVEPFDDAPSTAKTPADKPADSAKNTATNGCPVSMVTGEELLTLTDGELDGRVPFAWTRLYRTSAVELDCGMGPGWSHALAQRLEITEDAVIWTNEENSSTSFPIPTAQRPAIHNSLSRAAIYLGENNSELVVAQAGDSPRFLHFRTDDRNGTRLTAISDKYGNQLTVEHDYIGRVTRIGDFNRRLELRYHNSQLIAVDYQRFTQERHEETYSWKTVNTPVTYGYDEQQRLIEARNAAGETEHYRYDEQHVIQERQLAGGARFFWEWEREGKHARCVRHWANFAQMDTRYQWGDDGSVTLIHADGSEETYAHNDQARLIRKVDPDGAEHLKAYDDQGRLVAEKDPLGNVTEFHYNEAGRLTSIIPTDEEPTLLEYRDGFVSRKQRGDAVWQFWHNEHGDVICEADPDGHKTYHDYDTRGRLNHVSYPGGSAHRFTWNDNEQLHSETLPDGRTFHYAYDDLGRLTVRQHPDGTQDKYAWDAVGRLIQSWHPNGTSRRYSYNAYGKVTSETDELDRVTRYEYADGLHLVSRKINPDDSEVNYRYDNARLQLSEIKNENGRLYHLDYYPNGLIQQETDFEGRRTAYAYDLKGQLQEKTEFGAEDEALITRYERDAGGRLLTKTLPDGEQVTFRYDTLGRLIGVNDGHCPLGFEYDLQDRLIAEHQGWATSRYRYDPLGQLSHCRLPDGNTLDYQYHDGGPLKGIDLNAQCLTRHGYFNSLETKRQQGALVSTSKYDEQGRLLEFHAGQRYSRQYQYAANDNLTGVIDSRKGEKRYVYNDMDRLTEVRDQDNRHLESFLQDRTGTLLIDNGQDGLKGLATGNRVDSHGNTQYEYDAYGNLIRERRGSENAQVTHYRYDCQHRLIGVTQPDGRTSSYRYDAFGRRISKTVEGRTTEFVWQGDRLIAETDAKSDNNYRTYVYEPGTFRPLALLDGHGKTAEVYHYQLDHLGTPQTLTDTEGTLRWSANYTAYGKVENLDINDIHNPLRFQGQYHDQETGLHYNRHRYYNPESGRFLTPDPIKLAGGMNAYLYVPNPTGWVDPLGLNANCPGAGGCKPDGKQPGDVGGVRVDEGGPTIPRASFRPKDFANEQKLIEHYDKHGSEFGSKNKEDYLSTARYVIDNGTQVQYLYKDEARTGYIKLIGNNSKGQAKFSFVGTNNKEEITTLHTKSGKDFWKAINNDAHDKTVRPYND
jgi:RHS repeat-associated protein